MGGGDETKNKRRQYTQMRFTALKIDKKYLPYTISPGKSKGSEGRVKCHMERSRLYQGTGRLYTMDIFKKKIFIQFK